MAGGGGGHGGLGLLIFGGKGGAEVEETAACWLAAAGAEQGLPHGLCTRKPGFVFLFLHKNQPKMVFTLHVCYFFLKIKDTFTSVGRHHLTGLPNISKKC